MKFTFYFLSLLFITGCGSKEINKSQQNQATPKITALSISEGNAGDKMTITGRGFSPECVVMFANSKVSAIIIGVTQIELTVPKGEGSVSIVVMNGTASSNALTFTYTIKAPVITTISKSEGIEADTVIINGTYFSPYSSVYFGAVTAPVINISAEQIMVKVPSSPQSGLVNISVYTGTKQSNKISFNVFPSYTNPVFNPILADPTFLKDPVSGSFYAFGTGDYWYTDKRDHLVAVVKSTDFINWTYFSDAFSNKPTWKPTNAGIWAPDINYVNGRYYMYYSYSTWGDSDPGIGLAIADRPAGPFIDQGKLFLSSEIDVRNSIDPFYYEESGRKYLFWGSFRNNGSQTQWGTFVIELSEDGKSVVNLANKVKIAASDFEGVVIHKRGNYYYFFGSKGGCCSGVNSTYHMRVGRASNVKGPYYDKAGNNIATTNGAGTTVLDKNNVFVGPGHASKIITDKKGQDWILYHAMPNDNTQAIIDGVNQRALMLDKVNWSADGWPLINDGTPSYKRNVAPKFN